MREARLAAIRKEQERIRLGLLSQYKKQHKLLFSKLFITSHSPNYFLGASSLPNLVFALYFFMSTLDFSYRSKRICDFGEATSLAGDCS